MATKSSPEKKTLTLLNNAFNTQRAWASKTNQPPAALRILLTLELAKNALTISRAAQEVGITASSLGRQLAALSNAGLVSMDVDVEDQRRTYVSITLAGRELLKEL